MIISYVYECLHYYSGNLGCYTYGCLPWNKGFFLSHAGNQATFLSVAETNVLNDFLNYFGLTCLQSSSYRLSQPMRPSYSISGMWQRGFYITDLLDSQKTGLSLHLSLDLVEPNLKVRLATEETCTCSCQPSTYCNFPIFITQVGRPFGSSFLNHYSVNNWCILHIYFSAKLRCNWHLINCTYLSCIILWFDINRLLWNHHHNQDTEHSHHPPKFPLACLESNFFLSPPTLPTGNH